MTGLSSFSWLHCQEVNIAKLLIIESGCVWIAVSSERQEEVEFLGKPGFAVADILCLHFYDVLGTTPWTWSRTFEQPANIILLIKHLTSTFTPGRLKESKRIIFVIFRATPNGFKCRHSFFVNADSFLHINEFELNKQTLRRMSKWFILNRKLQSYLLVKKLLYW